MELCNYQIFEEPASPSACLNNIRTFAVANGWTQDHWQLQKRWGLVSTVPTVYGWLNATDDEAFLQLYSTGRDGKQPHVYRLWTYRPLGTPYTNWNMYAQVHATAKRVFSTASSAAPALQDGLILHQMIGQVTFMQNNAGASIRQWVFGNSAWIYSIVQLAAEHFSHQMLGVPEILDPNDPTGAISWNSCIRGHIANSANYTHSSAYADNYLTAGNNFAVLGAYRLPSGGGAAVSYLAGLNIHRLQYGWGGDSMSTYTGYANNFACLPQPWSGKRIIQPLLMYRRPTNLTHEPFAYMPFGVTPFPGLVAGTTLAYGNEEYMILPIRTVTQPFVTTTNLASGLHAGLAFRVA